MKIFSFYFTNASLALFANGINWVDGLLSTIIMAILSILICFFVIMFCRDMLVNDDEEKDELRVSKICLHAQNRPWTVQGLNSRPVGSEARAKVSWTGSWINGESDT